MVLGGVSPKNGSPELMCTSNDNNKSLLPTLGAPPNTKRPPGVNNLGAIKSSGIGVSSFKK